MFTKNISPIRYHCDIIDILVISIVVFLYSKVSKIPFKLNPFIQICSLFFSLVITAKKAELKDLKPHCVIFPR